MVKIMISMDEHLLDEIDKYCFLNSQSRSGFIRLAVSQYLNNYRLTTSVIEKTIGKASKSLINEVLNDESGK